MAFGSVPAYNLLDDAITRYGTKTAIDFEGKKYTYTALGKLVNKAAKGLQKIGVDKGVRVGLMLPNCPLFIISYFAILKAGGTVVNFNPLYSVRELQQQIEDSQTSIMITLNLKLLYSNVRMLLFSTTLEKLVIGKMEDMLPFAKGLFFKTIKKDTLAEIYPDIKVIFYSDIMKNDGLFTPPAIDPGHDCAILQYTGGTTGISKGAVLTHANITANAYQAGAWFTGLDEGGEIMLGALPLFHAFAMTGIMNLGLLKGACIILHPRFELAKILRSIEKDHVTLILGVPTMFTAMANAINDKPFTFSSVKLCVSGGAPLPLEVKERFEKASGCRLVEGYGLTEASPIATVNPLWEKAKANSSGIPLPGTMIEIRDIAPPHNLLNTKEVGEICVMGPQVMQGYWNNPAETAKVLKEGRLHTGDLGYLDEDGYLFIIDRLKEMIIASGYNIYPRHVEEMLYMHPAIAEAAVIGVPHEYRGQTVKACIVCRKGQTVTAEELQAFLKDKLAIYEIPTLFAFMDDLPKTLIGKISKKLLK
jgi:long-chain acyl-CoA synthetase